MAAKINGVWAIDVGDNSLKALHLQQGEEGYEVIGFDYIEHSKVLSPDNVTPEERSDIIAETVQEFIGRNEIGNDEVAISVAGHNSFARFIEPPPMEEKEIPRIVQYEAVQQIPFDINEVEWDWQIMEGGQGAKREVGIFAVKNDLVGELLEHFRLNGCGRLWQMRA